MTRFTEMYVGNRGTREDDSWLLRTLPHLMSPWAVNPESLRYDIVIGFCQLVYVHGKYKKRPLIRYDIFIGFEFCA
jgi:hypothetical protein